MPPPEDYKWELYDLTKDYSQEHDLAATMPDKLKEMQKIFRQEAEKYQVYPLDNDTFARALAPRPSPTAGQTVFTYSGVVAGIPTGNSPNYLGKSYTITALVDVPEGGGDGMLVTQGGKFGGIGLYLLKGKPVFDYNMMTLAHYRWAGQNTLTAGKHTIEFDFTYDGPGIGKGGTGVLKVDGKDVDSHTQPNSVAFLEVADDLRRWSGHYDRGNDDYQVPFAFNGKIDKLIFKIGPSQLLPADKKAAADANGKVND